MFFPLLSDVTLVRTIRNKKNGSAAQTLLSFTRPQQGSVTSHAGNQHILKSEWQRQQLQPGCHISKSPFLATTPLETSDAQRYADAYQAL